MRRKNTKERLDKGVWFQGNERYIFVGFSKRSAGNLSTRSIGFVVSFDDNFKPHSGIEVSFKNEKDQQLVDCYRTITEQVSGLEKKSDIHYVKLYNDHDIFENLNLFLTVDKPIIDKVIKEKGLENKLFIDDSDFDRSLNNILKRREGQKKGKPPVPQRDDKWNTLVKVINQINKPEAIRIFFKLAKLVLQGHNLKMDDERFYCAALTEDKYIHLTLGSRYIVHVSKTRDKSAKIGITVTIEDENRIHETFSKIYKSGYCEDRGNKFAMWAEVPYNEVIPADWEASILEASQFELRQSKSQFRNRGLHNPWIYKAAFDDKILDELLGEKVITDDDNNDMIMNNIPLNQILFGPPGTGKTYSTVDEALKIVDPEFYIANSNDRSKLTERFKELLIKNWDNPKGQIAFCTFHQSFSYEDFVEGIKPLTTENKTVYYDIVNGVFKNICQLSLDNAKVQSLKTNRLINWSDSKFKKAIFYKISLGDSNKPEDNIIYEYCIDNNYIAIGYGGGIDFSNLSETEIRKKCKTNNLEGFDAQALISFIKYIKIGNYVVVSNGNRHVRAMGKVIGDYEFLPETPLQYNNFRKVEWIFINENIPVEEIYNRNLSQMPIYKLDTEGINKNFFVNGQSAESYDIAHSDNNFVLIIDEINRGNISNIFGELITLIEKDKRKGGDEELTVSLPYSKQLFNVPQNVYIIGTMNTADRSIEALDTALRRRFSFKEVAPNSNIISEKGYSKNTKGIVEDIDLVKLLETINERVEKLLDKDHKIGHSYFMKVKSHSGLVKAFKNKVIPLLEEYFYGDFGKIGLVLGNEFITVKGENAKDFSFASFKNYDADVISDLKERKVYEITDSDDWSIASFKSIYDTSTE